ncbi:MAG TPA: hypothetical protein VKC11_00630 [Steroidobacteraceae bacterium]|nr:hypothetical protein [Steroidobacteraceae bacterium]
MLVWKHPQDFVKHYQPAGLVQEFLHGLHPLIRQTEGGKFALLVPAGNVPLRTLKTLHDTIGRSVEWRLLELAEDGELTEVTDTAPVRWVTLTEAEYRRAIKAQPA